MFAVICIPDFALQAVLRHEPFINTRLKPGAKERASLPVALLNSAPSAISKSVVLECTEAAKTAGVRAGLSAPQALARCPHLVLRTRSATAEQGATDVLLQTVYAFSPYIESTAPGVCTIDLRGLNFENARPHPGPLRQGEGERDSAFSMPEYVTTHSALSSQPKGSGGELQSSFGFLQETPKCSPSPWGEGRGEGETNTINEWGRNLIAALRQCELHAQIGIALTPNLALVAAQVAKPVLVINQPHDFFASLPIAALEPAPELPGILKRWGIHTAGEFFALGKDAIAERLGAAALELFERASTQTIRPLNIVVPADTFEEQMDFEVEIETLEPLLFVLRRFIEQLATRIALSYRVVAELQLRLMLSSGTSHERLFRIPAPTASVGTLFRMLHTHLENLHTETPIVSLRLGAMPARAGHQQFGLFESALGDPNHFHETLARLTALMGAERVGTPIVEATHRPDSFGMNTPEFGNSRSPIADGQSTTRNSKPETRNSSGLCLRRFRPPFHAEVELRDGRPAFVSTLKFTGSVVRSRGPWCASGHWWDSRRWLRQEWDVETREGTVYRLYHANNDWRVEGVYD